MRAESTHHSTLFLAALHTPLARRRLSRTVDAAPDIASRGFAARAGSGSIAATPGFLTPYRSTRNLEAPSSALGNAIRTTWRQEMCVHGNRVVLRPVCIQCHVCGFPVTCTKVWNVRLHEQHSAVFYVVSQEAETQMTLDFDVAGVSVTEAESLLATRLRDCTGVIVSQPSR